MDEKTKELARLAGFIVGVSANADRQIEQFATLIRQDEREACARLCDDLSEVLVGDDVDGAWGAGHCARAIEARGEKHD